MHRRREMSRTWLRARLLAWTRGVSRCFTKTHKTTAMMTHKHRAVQASDTPRDSANARKSQPWGGSDFSPCLGTLGLGMGHTALRLEREQTHHFIIPIFICKTFKYVGNRTIPSHAVCILMPSDEIFRHIKLESVAEKVKWNFCTFLMGM